MLARSPAEPANRTEEPPPEYTSRMEEPPEYGLPPYDNAVMPDPLPPAYSPRSDGNPVILRARPPVYTPIETPAAPAPSPRYSSPANNNTIPPPPAYAPESPSSRFGVLGPRTTAALEPTLRDAVYNSTPYTCRAPQAGSQQQHQSPSLALARLYDQSHARSGVQYRTPTQRPSQHSAAHHKFSVQNPYRSQPVSQWELRRQRQRQRETARAAEAAAQAQVQVRDFQSQIQAPAQSHARDRAHAEALFELRRQRQQKTYRVAEPAFDVDEAVRDVESNLDRKQLAYRRHQRLLNCWYLFLFVLVLCVDVWKLCQLQ